jgi:hypothetical protein
MSETTNFDTKPARLETIARMVSIAHCMRRVIDAAAVLMESEPEHEASRILEEALTRWRRPPGGSAAG